MAWHPTAANVLAATTSTGQVIMAKLRMHRDNCTFDAVPAASPLLTHTLEAWCVAFSIETKAAGQKEYFTLYSGGDDSTLRYVSGAVGDSVEEEHGERLPLELPYAAAKVDGHGAGVTAILPLSATTAAGARLVVTGSYDDIVRVYSIMPLGETYGMRNAKLVAELNLGGGVWRLRLIRELSINHEGTGRRGVTATILVSCMHAGARIVEVCADTGDSAECSIAVLGRFEEHKSMNYGSDFQPGPAENKALLCVSSSFYDKLLCLWNFSIPE